MTPVLRRDMVATGAGRREGDQLIQVHWKDGDPNWIPVHVEVQA